MPSKRHSGRKGKCFWKAANTQILNEAGGERGQVGSRGKSGWKDAWGSWGPEPGPNPCPAEEGATEGPGQGWGLPGNWGGMPARAGGWQCSWQGAQWACGRASGHAPWLVRAPAAELPKAVLQSGHWHGGHGAGQEAGASRVPRPQGMPGPAQEPQGVGTRGRGDSQA